MVERRNEGGANMSDNIITSPGEAIERELNARGWIQADLAQILGKSSQMVSDLVQSKRPITPEIAKLLAIAFETTPEHWISLDAKYRFAQSKQDDHEEDAVSRRAKLYAEFPIRQMAKRGWIDGDESADSLEATVSRFVSSGPAFAARRREDVSKRGLQMAWLFRAHQIAKKLHVPPFSETKLKAAMENLRPLLFAEEETRNIPRILNESGIRFMIIEPLRDSKIDGVCFWLDKKWPVVAVSLRYDRIDHFWFVLMHEIHHVLLRHGMTSPKLDVNMMEAQDLCDEERGANEGAQEFLIPSPEINDFIARVRPVFSPMQVRGFARRIGVHPGIVVGQLQHRGLIGFNQHRKMLVPVRKLLTSTSVYDGWGMIA